MPDPTVSPSDFPPVVSAFGPFWKPGRLGGPGETGVFVAERRGLALASLIGGRDRTGLAAAAKTAFGLDLPDRPACVTAGAVSAIGIGPGKWLLLAEQSRAAGFVTETQRALGGLGSVVDQSDGRGVIRLSGPRARDTLAKGLPIDLHPAVFGPGDAASSFIAQIAVTIWQVDAAPTYDIAAPRSFAGSFLHWLGESAAVFGCEWA